MLFILIIRGTNVLQYIFGGFNMDLETVQQQFKNANVSDTFGTRKEVKYLPEILSDDEIIQYATSGLVEGNTVLVVCTNERVLFVDKGMVYGVRSNEIPLDMVNGVSYSKGMLMGNIIVTNGAKDTLIKDVSKETAPLMVDAIKSSAKEYKRKLHQASQSSIETDNISMLISQNEKIISLLKQIAAK